MSSPTDAPTAAEVTPVAPVAAVAAEGVDEAPIAAGGAEGFEPPSSIRADQNRIDGVRMPYLKFPRNPTNLGK